MGPQNLNPLDELKSLDQQVEQVNDLAGLKPIFFRLEQIAQEHPNDFEVQLAVGDIKQHLVNRGTKLKQAKQAAPEPPPAAAPPPMPPALPAEMPPTRKLMSSGQFTKPSGLPETAPPVVPSVAQPPVPPSQAPPEPTVILPPPPPPLEHPSLQEPLATVESASFPVPPPAPPPAPPRQVIPPQVPLPPSRPPGPPTNWKRAVWIGAAIGTLIAVVGIGTLVGVRRRNLGAAAAGIQVQIATTPPGASVRINGENKCTSDCTVSLAAGNYQVTAFLDGYEPAATGLTVTAGQPASVSLPLEPQAQSLRILTDLDSGKVAIDGQPPADLQEGQFIVDRIQPGQHTVKLTGKTGEASFAFEIVPAKAPSITGPVTARNLNAVLVSSVGSQAHVVTNAGPLKLAVNGQPEADAGPAGVDLKGFQSGVDELILGEGKDQRSVKENFGPAPMLTAFLKSDLNIGTLIVATGEDNVRIFLNNKEYPRRTQRGQVRIQTIGNVSVRVMKDGFDSPPVQTAEVKKGAETRLEFTLKAAPQVASLQISGGTPGAEVLIDQKSLGQIGADGNFSNNAVQPGDRVIEMRKDQFVTRRVQRLFRAGQTVTLSGSDVTLAAAERLPPPPAPVKIPQAPPPKPLPPPPAAGTIADFEDSSAWRQENGVWLHKGGGFVAYKLPPKGTFTFTVELVKGGGIFRGGRIRWYLNYTDSKNYALYELESKNFWAKVVMNGKTFERSKIPLKDLEKQKSFTIQIDVTPEHIVHKMFAGGDWMNLDSWAEPGRNFSDGKFGFLIQGNDEIGLTDFKFLPK